MIDATTPQLTDDEIAEKMTARVDAIDDDITAEEKSREEHDEASVQCTKTIAALKKQKRRWQRALGLPTDGGKRLKAYPEEGE